MGNLQLGYNMYNVFALVSKQLIQPRPDFIEMVLHHFCTCLLLCLGYANDQLKVGAVILVTHNWTDITVAMAKCTSELQYNNVFIFAGLSNIILWFWTRIYTFGTLIHTCYYALPVDEILGRLKFENDRQSFLNTIWMSRVLTGVIFLLQINWFYLMLKILVSFFNKSKTITKISDGSRLLGQVEGAHAQ